MPTKEYYEALLDNPNVQRGLALIRYTEGTAKYDDPYAIAFGGRKFDYSGGHPGTLFDFRTKSGERQKTSAHGAYQFLGRTWNNTASRLGLKTMEPRNQDIAALALIDGRGGLGALKKGDITTFVKRVGPEWASLPTAPKSYGQPTKSWSRVRSFWDSAAQPQVAASRLPDQGPVPTFRPATPSQKPAGGREAIRAAYASYQQATRQQAPQTAPKSVFAGIVGPNQANAASQPGNKALLNFNRTMGTAPDIADAARNIAFTAPNVPVTLRPDRPMPSGPLPTLPKARVPAAEYQKPAFTTGAPSPNQYGHPPIPGLQPVAQRVTPPSAPMAQPVQVPQVFPPAPRAVPAPVATIRNAVSNNRKAIAGALIGGALGGLPGAAVGGMIGSRMQNGGSFLPSFAIPQHQPMQPVAFANPAAFNNALGFGGTSRASEFVQSGYAPQGAAYQDSAGGVSVSGGNGYSERTNRYGATSIRTPDGRDAAPIGGGLFSRIF